MTICLSFVESIPDRAALTGLMAAYYPLMGGKLKSAGGPDVDTDAVVETAWNDIDRLRQYRDVVAL